METTQLAPATEVKRLTKLERKWYGEFLKDFDALEAFRRVKRKEITNGSISVSVVNSQSYQVRDATLRKLGITDDDIRKQLGLNKQALDRRLVSLMDAKKEIVVNGELREVSDNQVRAKAVELGYKLTGELKDKVELTGRDGEALQMQVVAGIGFIRPKRDE